MMIGPHRTCKPGIDNLTSRSLWMDGYISKNMGCYSSRNLRNSMQVQMYYLYKEDNNHLVEGPGRLKFTSPVNPPQSTLYVF